MGAIVTVMVSPQLADGCDVTDEAAAALVADGWTPPPKPPRTLTSRDSLSRVDKLQP